MHVHITAAEGWVVTGYYCDSLAAVAEDRTSANQLTNRENNKDCGGVWGLTYRTAMQESAVKITKVA